MSIILHRHALESVFAFSPLHDLHVMLCVCKDWRAAVRSMQSVHASIATTPEKLLRVCASSLVRHVSGVNMRDRGFTAASVDLMQLLALRLPNLRHLDNARLFSFERPLVQLPQKLQRLQIAFPIDASSLQHDQAIRCLATLPHLEVLSICMMSGGGCSFEPLCHQLSLRAFALKCPQPLSDTNIAQLRALTQLHSFELDGIHSHEFTRLLTSPHQLRWQRCGVPLRFTADTCGAAIISLPSLTVLNVVLDGDHADFLDHLPSLTDLTLQAFGRSALHPASVERIMLSLCSLGRLRRLTLSGGGAVSKWQCHLRFTSTQLLKCFAHMPLLTSLCITIAAHVDSLRFLEPLAHSLQTLELFSFLPRLKLDELRYVRGLRSLRNLSIADVFAGAPGVETLRRSDPPLLYLPSLEQCIFFHR